MASGGIVLHWKLDGDDVANESALIRTFLIIDGNSWNVDFFQYPLHRHQLPTDQSIAKIMASGGIVLRWKLDGCCSRNI